MYSKGSSEEILGRALRDYADRDNDAATGRAGSNPFADKLYNQGQSDRVIIDAVAAGSTERLKLF